jgi:hypothetical protein
VTEIDSSNIISGRRTRGKEIDFASLPSTEDAEVDDDEEEDEEEVEEGDDEE